MTPWFLIILIVGTLLTSTISGVIGMGGGIVLLSIMTFLMPIQELVPIHGMVQMVSNSARAGLLHTHVRWRVLGWFSLGLPAGAGMAIYVIQQVQDPTLWFGLIAAIILYAIFKPSRLPPLIIPLWGFSVLGVVVGILGPLVGATGPLLAPFFLRPDFSKENIVATKAAVQTLGHLIKIPVFLSVGFNYSEYGWLMALMAVGAIIGTQVGVTLLKKMPPHVFVIIFKSALLVAALRLIYKTFAA